MILLTREQTISLRDRFLPERLGAWPMVPMHVIQTGNGAFFADRWPNPQVILASTTENYYLAGNPEALVPEQLSDLVVGFLDAEPAFEPILSRHFPNTWDRVAYSLEGKPHIQPGESVRRLVVTDAYHLWGLNPESNWIYKTWGGPHGLAASGYGWGAFVDGRLASVACTAFLGATYEEIGVITEAEFRGRGLAAQAAGALCIDIQSRGRIPSWSTETSNIASIRVAEKLGFSGKMEHHIFVNGIDVPESAQKED